MILWFRNKKGKDGRYALTLFCECAHICWNSWQGRKNAMKALQCQKLAHSPSYSLVTWLLAANGAWWNLSDVCSSRKKHQFYGLSSWSVHLYVTVFKNPGSVFHAIFLFFISVCLFRRLQENNFAYMTTGVLVHLLPSQHISYFFWVFLPKYFFFFFNFSNFYSTVLFCSWVSSEKGRAETASSTAGGSFFLSK